MYALNLTRSSSFHRELREPHRAAQAANPPGRCGQKHGRDTWSYRALHRPVKLSGGPIETPALDRLTLLGVDNSW